MNCMDLCFIGTQLMIVVIITGCPIDEVDCECPGAYWDEPSKLCAQPLNVALEHHHPTDNDVAESAQLLKVNTTCIAWHQTDTCYQQLLRKCRSDERARQEIQMHIGRYRVYSLTCSAHKYRHRLVDCFLPHIRPTRTCSEAFDRYFRNFISDKQFRNACRVVSTAMKCFHEIKTDVGETCNEEAADEYQRNYIQPLVDQTRDTVTSKCTMSPPYDHYFNVSPSSERNAYYVLPSLVALLFSRWRHNVRYTC